MPGVRQKCCEDKLALSASQHLNINRETLQSEGARNVRREKRRKNLDE